MSSVGSCESSGDESSSLQEDQLSSVSSLPGGELDSEDLAAMIALVKRTILETEECGPARRELVHKLIRLRLRVAERADSASELSDTGEQEVAGHRLQPDTVLPSSPTYCDQCCGVVLLLQSNLSCRVCGYRVHSSCVAYIRRHCVGAFLGREPGAGAGGGPWDGSLELRICPERSLAEQDFQCLECGHQFTAAGQSRLCDYTGGLFCYSCHWGATSPSPARLLASWDPAPRPVCQAALQYLAVQARRPLLALQEVSPGLQAVIGEVGEVVRQRERMLSMKRYLVVCRLAQEQRLLTQLQDRQHFVENSTMFSFQDLLDLQNGVLHQYLQARLDTFLTHISSCVLCTAKGFLCELCPPSPGRQTIFPFDELVEVCSQCEAVFHRDCFRSVTGCPRCERKKEKKCGGALKEWDDLL